MLDNRFCNVLVDDMTQGTIGTNTNRVMFIDLTTALATQLISSPLDLVGGSPALMSALEFFYAQNTAEVVVTGIAYATAGDAGVAWELAQGEFDCYFTVVVGGTKVGYVEIDTKASTHIYKQVHTTHLMSTSDLEAYVSNNSKNLFVWAMPTGYEDNVASGILGAMSSYNAGGGSFAYKALNGLAPTGHWTRNNEAKCKQKKLNYVTNLMDRTITYGGGVSQSGEFANIKWEKDYIVIKLVEAVTALRIRSRKLPYDSIGVSKIRACIEEILLDARVNKGIIANDVQRRDENNKVINVAPYSIVSPDLSTATTNDRNLGILPPFEITVYVSQDINEPVTLRLGVMI